MDGKAKLNQSAKKSLTASKPTQSPSTEAQDKNQLELSLNATDLI